MVLITGSQGFIGRHLATRLSQEGHKVLGIDSRPREFVRQQNSIIDKVGATTDRKSLFKLFKEHPIQQVIHLGMTSTTREAMDNPEAAKKSILDGTLNLLEAMKASGARRVVFASTSMVYGDFLGKAVHEEDKCAPVEAYGSLKLQAEEMIKHIGQDSNIEYIIFRPIAVYGPGDEKERVVSKMINRARSGQKIQVNGGETELDFTYVEDVVRAIVLFIKNVHIKNEIFNIGRGRKRSLKDVVQIIKKYFPDMNYEITDRDPQLPQRGQFNVKKAKSMLNFQAQTELEEGISKIVKSL